MLRPASTGCGSAGVADPRVPRDTRPGSREGPAGRPLRGIRRGRRPRAPASRRAAMPGSLRHAGGWRADRLRRRAARMRRCRASRRCAVHPARRPGRAGGSGSSAATRADRPARSRTWRRAARGDAAFRWPPDRPAARASCATAAALRACRHAALRSHPAVSGRARGAPGPERRQAWQRSDPPRMITPGSIKFHRALSGVG